MLDVDATFHPEPDAPDGAPRDAVALLIDTAATDDPSPAPATDIPKTITSPDPEAEPAADARTVTPRRPLRFSSARGLDDSPAVAAPIFNIFEGVFDPEEAGLTDPRLQRSRARARSLLAAREATLSDEERNLWHDDPQPEPPAPVVPVPDPAPHGRRVRHLTAADLIHRHASGEAIVDPLREHLHAVRDALYLPDPDAPEPAPQTPDLPQRLTVQALNLVLLVVALPIGAALALITFLRGEDLRLSARTVAVVGCITALLRVAPLPPL